MTDVACCEQSPDLQFACERDMAHRQFEARKEQLINEDRASLVRRVASLLLYLSSQNAREGKDPTVIAESLTCKTVAEFLNISIERLGRALVELRNRGLIAEGPAGSIRLIAIKPLELFVDEQHEP
jgi:CRP/FNR family transcriptional regulator